MTMGYGVLPKQDLLELAQAGFVKGIGPEYFNPASIDLPLSAEAYRLETVYLPRANETVRSLLPGMGAQRHDLAHALEVGVQYLVRVELEEGSHLPDCVYGYANPKSSTGRLGLFCRTMADRVPMYDSLKGVTKLGGWAGELWVLISTEYFPVLLTPGLAVSQMRFFNGKAFLDTLDMEIAVEKHGLLYGPRAEKIPFRDMALHSDSIYLTLRVGEGMGFECVPTRKVLDLRRRDYDPADFFRPVVARNGSVKLSKGRFYILTTGERVMVPPNLSAELRAIDVRLGEFRTHAAGYIDPGWGYGKDGGACGRPITLEIIMLEDRSFRDGEQVARIRYERMKDVPSTLYDDAASNYVQQENARLSKHFKQ
jgi:dCTP deaminase